MSDNFLEAAALADIEYTDAVAYGVDEAIRLKDPAKIWELIDSLAALDEPAYQAYRTRIAEAFPRRLALGKLDKERRRSRGKHFETVGRDTIQMSQRQTHEIADDAMAKLREKMKQPELFVRAGVMVEVRTTEDSDASIKDVSADMLLARIDRAARFIRGEAGVSSPKKDVAVHILSRPAESWELPTLRALVQTPVLRQDGTILDAAGYDHASGIYHRPHHTIKDIGTIPDAPCMEEVQEAVAVIEDVIGDFPFVDECSKANMIGLMLTPVVRPAYNGCTPLAIIDAPAQGTGKSLLAEVFCLISTGAPAAMTQYPGHDEELGKLIGAFLREGSSIICFDNVTSTLRSLVLAMALTSDRYKSRLLQQSCSIDIPQRAVWVATGNNVRLGEELRRRCYQIRVDAQTAKPYVGRQFRHPNIKAYVIENRAKIVAALLTIARAWFAAGRPRKPDHKPLGSFEQWDITISSILHFAGIPGFLGNLAAFQQEADDESESWEHFLTEIDGWASTRFDRGPAFSVRELISYINTNDKKEIMPDYLQMQDKKGSLSLSMAHAFRARQKKRFGPRELYLDKAGTDGSTKTSLWQVITPAPGPANGGKPNP
jgi:hypothetical protein